MKGFEGMEEMKIDHRHSRTRGANACAGRAVAPLPPRGRGTRPACPQWLVAICAFFAFTLTAPAADPTISISARQRYPWNGLVDLNFTITGTSGTKYDTSFTAKDIVGNTNITMATIRKADGSAANVTKESLLPGNYKWVWDAAADLPDGFECDQVTVTGVAVELTHLYMVIDLSSGPDSTSYPVSYLDAVPDGGWSDEYKTTKLVLRRIEPGTFKMCGQYNVTLTRPFYIGVFEVTQKQYENITGERPSVFQTSYEVRPVDHLFYYNIRLSFSSDVPLNSFIGKIRERTGISNIDFPTEAQWEYACRAGTTTDYNNGKDNTSGEQDPAMEEIGRYWHNGGSQASNYTKYSSYPLTSGTAAVGSYAPNEWGLYDMHGNVCEWCLDKLDNVQEGMIDPEGSLGFQSIMRGGGWRSRAEECTSIFRRTAEAQYVIYHNAAPIDGIKSTTIETTYKKMTTSIEDNNPSFRYKVVLQWKNMPSTRSYDIIGIGYPASVKNSMSPIFEDKYCTTATNCHTSTAYSYAYTGNNGIGVVFPLPSGSLYSMTQTLYVSMMKNTSSTIYTQYAYGDYAHAVENVSLNTAKSFIVNTSGIVHNNGSGNSYDTINYAKAVWNGVW